MLDNYIAIAVLISAIIGIVAVVVYRKKQNNETVTISDFINAYHMNIIKALSDVVELLMVNIDSFEDKEDYERAIVTTTLQKIKENCEDFGINPVVLNMVSEEVLIDILYKVLYTDTVQVFINSLTSQTAIDKADLFDEEVVQAVTAPEGITNEEAEAIIDDILGETENESMEAPEDDSVVAELSETPEAVEQVTASEEHPEVPYEDNVVDTEEVPEEVVPIFQEVDNPTIETSRADMIKLAADVAAMADTCTVEKEDADRVADIPIVEGINTDIIYEDEKTEQD